MPRPKQSGKEKDARRRLRRITPKNAGKVVARDIYWTLPFLTLYLDHVDSVGFSAPEDGYLLALQGPNLSRLVPSDRGEGSYSSEKEQRSFEIRALFILASLERATGRLSDAEGHFAHAFTIARKTNVFPDTYAELVRRHGYFLFTKRDPGALKRLRKAVALFRQTENRNGLADALISLGIGCCELEGDIRGGIQHFAEAIAVADQRSVRGAESITAALANLGYALSLGATTLADQDRARAFIEQAREGLNDQPRSKLKAHLLWIEGILYHNLHFARHGARLISRARRMLFDVGALFDYAFASLDLVIVLLDDEEQEEAGAIRRETEAALAESDPELLQALGQWDRKFPARSALEGLKRKLGRF